MATTRVRGLPHFAVGTVVKGFGRGSKELGIPTANFPEHVVEELPDEITTGIYYGWAKVDDGPTFKMVMSIGWNPYYNNKKKSMETHIMHVFKEDFYGSELKVVMLGYIRPEKNFKSLEELITAIHNDISESDKQLLQAQHLHYKQHPFFTEKSGAQCNGVISNGVVTNVHGKENGLANGNIEQNS
ncbi:riboflavin kinase-like isoform X2 [Homarus americanus]|uniref:riboflavin kinase-like isoform X2 n=1 Tax=Homarus americanus TaxID=6706 RepID=UPI001C487075|nr:riboflavin kinase-like isoform X2 [Homarus americanus]